MLLTRYEEEMLNGSHGPAKRRAMELLVAYGAALGAERFVETNNVHMLIGFYPYPDVLDSTDPDDLASKFFLDSDQKIIVEPIETFNTTHIWATDLERGNEIGAPESLCLTMQTIRDYAIKKRICLSATCTPYQTGNLPQRGEHCAWTESSAVPFCNAVLGARTNTETAHSAFSIAVTGRVPLSGFHIEDNRRATHLIELEIEADSVLEWSLVGYFAGEAVQLAVPAYQLGKNRSPNLSMLKALNAAGASSGGIQMYHIIGATPEAPDLTAATGGRNNLHRLHYGKAERKQTLEKLNSGNDERVDVVTLGCPNYSIEQIREVARLLDGKKIKPDTTLWIWTAYPIKALADRNGFTRIIENAGARLLTDSCPLVTKGAFPDGARSVATDSAKQAHYTPAITGCATWLGSMEECVMAGLSGKFEGEVNR